MDERNKIEKVRQLGLALGTDKLELPHNAKLSGDKPSGPLADQFATHLIWSGKDPMLPEVLPLAAGGFDANDKLAAVAAGGFPWC